MSCCRSRFPWSQVHNLGNAISSQKLRRFVSTVRILHPPRHAPFGPAVIGSNRPNTGVREEVTATCDSSAAMFSAHSLDAEPGSHEPCPLLQDLGYQRARTFRIEVPCDNSCDNSWPIGGNHGESRSVTRADASRSDAQTRRSQAYDLLFQWWPGAGSNRRPSDFQAEMVIFSPPRPASRAASIRSLP